MSQTNCAHTILFRGLCCDCGADFEKLNIPRKREVLSAASVSMVHSVPELRITREYAEKLGKDDESRLLRERKLVLLVDLDQTLIHTTHDPGENDSADIHQYRLREGATKEPLYRTKLRPFQKEFFHKLADKFEFHVCTFGARMYAHKIAKLLDPEGKYFSHRILSRNECLDPQTKTGNLKELFPCGTSMVCIIDDREDVWNYAPNLVQVKPYNYFEYTKDDGKKVPKVEKDTDDYLLNVLPDILTKIHKKFFDDLEKKKRYLVEGEDFKLPDLKEIVPLVRKSTLSRVNIVFSGVIPLEYKEPERHKSWILARKLGATVTNEIIVDGYEQTTHIVARERGTAKVNRAIQINSRRSKISDSTTNHQIYIVTPHWLETCGERWCRVDEKEFSLNTSSSHSGYQGNSECPTGEVPMKLESRNPNNNEERLEEREDDSELETQDDGDEDDDDFDSDEFLDDSNDDILVSQHSQFTSKDDPIVFDEVQNEFRINQENSLDQNESRDDHAVEPVDQKTKEKKYDHLQSDSTEDENREIETAVLLPVGADDVRHLKCTRDTDINMKNVKKARIDDGEVEE